MFFSCRNLGAGDCFRAAQLQMLDINALTWIRICKNINQFAALQRHFSWLYCSTRPQIHSSFCLFMFGTVWRTNSQEGWGGLDGPWDSLSVAWFFHQARPEPLIGVWGRARPDLHILHSLASPPWPASSPAPLPDRSSCTSWQIGHVISKIPAALPRSQHFCQHSIWRSNFTKAGSPFNPYISHTLYV